MGMTKGLAGSAEGRSDAKDRAFTIHIDHEPFEVAEPALTGKQLRDLPAAAIGDDRDLWLEVPGGPDVSVGTGQRVSLRNDMHFFTAPQAINPGGESR
jgi:hypothetical protein